MNNSNLEHDNVISMHQVHKYYALEGIRVHALRGIDLTIDQGDYVAITGPSGSGKSTLMHILGCLDIPDSGEYTLNQNNVSHMDSDQLAELRNKEIGFVFQGFNLLARTTAIENVETPLIYQGVDKKERHQRAKKELERMGLGDRLNHLPTQLSGGQQQRVAIARSLVTRPTLLLADEPTGNVDTKTTQEILDVLDQLNRQQGLTILMITHEPEVAEHAKRRMVLRDGILV